MPRGRRLKNEPRTFRSLYERFLNFKRAEGLRPRTIEDYEDTLKDFAKFYDVDSPIDPEVLEEALLSFFKSKADKQPATYNRPYQNLHAFFEWCVGHDYLQSNPIKDLGLKKKRDDGDSIRHLSPDKLNKLIEAIDVSTYAGLRDYAIIMLTLDTGIRPKEAFSLTIDDIDFNELIVTVRKEHAKTKKERKLPISPATAHALMKLIEATPEEWGNYVFYSTSGVPYTSDAWAKRMQTFYQKKLGFRVTPYMLRHTFAISFLRNGGHVFALKYALGHTTTGTTQRYVQLVSQDIKDQHRIASPVKNVARKRLSGKVEIKRGPWNMSLF